MPIVLLVGQLLVQFGPQVAAEFQKLFSNPTPTQADWDNLFALANTPWKDRKTP